MAEIQIIVDEAELKSVLCNYINKRVISSTPLSSEDVELQAAIDVTWTTLKVRAVVRKAV